MRSAQGVGLCGPPSSPGHRPRVSFVYPPLRGSGALTSKSGKFSSNFTFGLSDTLSLAPSPRPLGRVAAQELAASSSLPVLTSEQGLLAKPRWRLDAPRWREVSGVNQGLLTTSMWAAGMTCSRHGKGQYYVSPCSLMDIFGSRRGRRAWIRR